MPLTNTPENLKRIRESELTELAKTILIARGKLSKKPTPQMKTYLKDLIKNLNQRIKVLNNLTGRTQYPKIQVGQRLELIPKRRRKLK
jgi:hypothetical protein